ncbi:MAG: glycerophosphodiester phosphodiesterase family protein [Candidatus Caldatribacteriota bacterium]|nr:glycerophosphodiester phosphodiesterase family protein [Candidatus Caldatribacteriota bacterium]
MKLPLIIGHRGAKGIAPENSLSGFKRAVELGIDGVELDVHLTRDGKLIVLHDMDLKRLIGQNIPIKQLTFKELKKYDISKLFNKNRRENIKKLPEKKRYFLELKRAQNNVFYLNIYEQLTGKKISFYLHWNDQQFDKVKKLFFPKADGKKICFEQLIIKKRDMLDLEEDKPREYHNEQIPLLGDVLRILKKKISVNIEIKGGENVYPGIVDKLAKETENFGYNNILFSSFNRDTAILLKERYPELKVNGLFVKRINHKKYIKGLDGLNPYTFWCKEGFVSCLHRLDKTVYVWTVDKDIDMVRFILYKVDGIITNYPQVLKKISKVMKSLLSDFY